LIVQDGVIQRSPLGDDPDEAQSQRRPKQHSKNVDGNFGHNPRNCEDLIESILRFLCVAKVILKESHLIARGGDQEYYALAHKGSRLKKGSWV
jgi:hypothetical protein